MVYGANSHLDRRPLRQSLTQFRTSSPWVVLGDFNAIQHPREKVGGNAQWSPHMDDINQCLFTSELDDLRFTGCLFTWSNKQVPPNFVASKLDRVLVNEPWMKSFTQSTTHFLVPGILDHSPAVVFVQPNPRKSIKPFRFFDFLADHPQFLAIVQRVWRTIVIGNPMFCVCEKLKHLQQELKQLNKAEFGGISERVSAIKQDLESIQAVIGSHPNNSPAIEQERLVHKQYITLLRAEESFAKQKSRIQWLKLGDQCTSYFFKAVSNRRNRSKITSLVLSDSSITNDLKVIKEEFVNFYTTLFGTPHPTPHLGPIRIEQLIRNKLSLKQSQHMVSPVSNLEIKETFWSINPSQGTGP